jgi:hypothetical protein
MNIYKGTQKTNSSTHLGIHYFEDTDHYRELDLLTWLPEMTALDINWTTLLADKERAIPESFISGLIQAGISTNIRFKFSFKDVPSVSEIAPLLQSYANWGVHSVQFFDRPNEKSNWLAADWTDEDVISIYLNKLYPFVQLASDYGLKTILPPLQPGGSYWDTIFLQKMLSQILQRFPQVHDQLILSAYAWTGKHSLNWGSGGSANWPKARPYISMPDVEDQRGFRIFDWYNEISEEVLGFKLPMVLHQCGVPADPFLPHPIQFEQDDLLDVNSKIYQLIRPEVNQTTSDIKPLPENILACNFWVLSAKETDAWANQAWFNENGSPTALGKAMQEKALKATKTPQRAAAPRGKTVLHQMRQNATTPNLSVQHPLNFVKKHSQKTMGNYFLLPENEPGLVAFFLEALNPYMNMYKPTFGFSTDEAKNAQRVVLVGGEQSFPSTIQNELQTAGCNVYQISGDGTEIATILAER